MYIITRCVDNRVCVPDVADTKLQAFNLAARFVVDGLKLFSDVPDNVLQNTFKDIIEATNLQTREKLLSSLPYISCSDFLEDYEITINCPAYTTTIQIFSCYENFGMVKKDL